MKIDLVKAKKQYFELGRSLSKSNKIRNQHVRLYFFIDENTSVRKLYGAISQEQKIQLSKTNKFNWWIADLHDEYSDLRQFAAYFANANSNHPNFSEELIKALFLFSE